MTVSPGSPAAYQMFLIPIGAFNGQATFNAYGVDQIPGATASWSQTSLTGSGTAIYTVNTSATTPLGSYPITLTAQSGNVTRTLTAWLVVQPSVTPTSQKTTARVPNAVMY